MNAERPFVFMQSGRRGVGEEEQEAASRGERRAHHTGRRGEPQPRQKAEGVEEAEGAGRSTALAAVLATYALLAISCGVAGGAASMRRPL